MKTIGWLLPLCAAFLLLSSLAHAFLGWPLMREGLVQAGVDPELRHGLAIGWYFGSVAMAAFGVILFLCWREVRSGAHLGRPMAACVAVAYIAFGAAAFLLSSYETHFLIAFILPGLLVGAAVVLGRWRS